MSELAEKGKKAWRADCSHGCRSRSEHVRVVRYENLNRPSHAPTRMPERDDDDGLTPAHTAAAPGNRAMCADADVDKGTMGNPYAPRDYSANRLSAPLAAGHQAPAAGGGDHGVSAGRNAEIAQHHPTLQQQATKPVPWYTGRTVNGDGHGERDLIYTPGTVAVSQLDLRSIPGMPEALLPSANPVARNADHIARDSAVPRVEYTDRADLSDPRSHAAPAAVKGAPLGGNAAMAVLKQVVRDSLGGGG